MIMKDIDRLLEKYFDGETSLEEEKLLRNYFRQSNIDERHKIYSPMFSFFSEERQEAVVEKKTKKIPAYAWIGIAASIILLVGVRTFYYTPLENTNTKSLVYINGKKVTDMKTINTEALNSIENISDMNEDVLNSQIDLLDSFTE